MIDIDAFFDPATSTVTYLVSDPETREAAIIDPVMDYEANAARRSTGSIDKVLQKAKREDLKIIWVLETHAHADHLSAADYIRRETGAKIGVGARIREVQETFAPVFGLEGVVKNENAFDCYFEDNETFSLGSTDVRVLHTPGHTPACVTYLIEDAALVGDTLFMPDYGTARADFPGGDAATLYRSMRRILELPLETRIFVGHDYLPKGRDAYAWETSVADERAHNIHVRDGVSEEEFVKMREARDATLATPKLILPALQVNIRAGDLPPPDDDGQIYLRLPVNRL